MDHYIVSARKYRPTTFESVVGQQALTQTLRNAIRSNRLAHAYLFCGPRGVGKTTCARIFAKTINCLNPSADHEACNQCESCQAFNEQRSFNIHELDAASNNSVEDIRSLIDQVRIPPQIGKYSVYIIDEVHMLSQAAFNALLKTLEEPPAYAIFILATTEKHKIIPTILSRCQVYDFSRITVQDTIQHLQYVAQKEGINATPEALNVVAQKADGGMRDALSIFDQLVAFCGTSITYEQAIAVLNVLDADYYFRLVSAAISGAVSDALLLFNDVLQHGFEAGHFITGFAQHLRDVLVSKDAATLQLLQTADSIRQRYQQQAAQCSAKWLFQALDLINTCDINYRTARNKRLTVELALVKLCLMLDTPVVEAAQPARPQPQSAAPKAPQPVPQAAPQPAPQAAAKPAPAPVQAAPQPAPAPAPKPAPVPQPAPAPKPAPVSMPSMPSMPAMPSLSNLGTLTSTPKAPQPKPVEEEQPKEMRSNPFTVDQLRNAWVGQVRRFPREERLKAMLLNYEIEMDSDTEFHITLDNVLQRKEFQRFGKDIMDDIRNRLQNDHIQLRVQVSDYVRHTRAYTSSDKFKLLNELNPHLMELRDTLHMLLD